MVVSWRDGDVVTAVGEVREVRRRSKRNGEPFWKSRLELVDGSQIGCVWWDSGDAPKAGDTVRVEGRVRDYQGDLEIHVRNTSRVAEDPSSDLTVEQRIIGYYGDCIEAESQQDLTVAPGQRGHLTIDRGIEPAVTHVAGHVWTLPSDEQSTRWAQDRLMAAGGESVLAGYPTVVGETYVDGQRRVRHAPLFMVEARVQRADHEDGFELVRIDGPIDVNVGALQLLGVDRSERNAITDAINRSEAVAIATTAAERFEAMIEVVWHLLALNDEVPHSSGLMPIDSASGIHNVALLLAASRQPMTRGLLDDLAALSDAPVENLRSGPLGIYLGAHRVADKTNRDPQSYPVVVPSCLAQDMALTGCMTEPFTVVTGPPGTGKSQVLVNAVSAAVVAGESVLFASRNNQAIDVVFERLAGTVPSSWPLRAGAARFRPALASAVQNALERPVEPPGAEAYIQNKWRHVAGEVKEIHLLVPARRELAERIERLERSLASKLQELPESLRPVDATGDLDDLIERVEQALDGFRGRLGLFKRWKRHNARLDLARASLKDLASEIGDPAATDLGAWQWIAAMEDRPRRSARLNAEARPGLTQLRSLADVTKLRFELSELRIDLAAMPPPWELDDRLAALEKERTEAGRRLVDLSWRQLMRNAKAEARQSASEFANRINPSDGSYGSSAPDLVPKMLAAFPVWGVTNLSVGSNFPVEAGLFDLVIIDEASQSDPASVLPLLFRAKRAVVIGDDRQLPHISSLNPGRHLTLAEKWRLDTSTQEQFAYPHRSAFAISRARVGGRPQFLNLHFRSHPSIIDFSNTEFYDRRLEICTDPSRYVAAPAVTWDDCKGQMIRGAGGRSWRNIPEAHRIAALAAEQARRSLGSGLSVGVVSAFRSQVEEIRKVLADQAPELIESITVDTAHRFQGDERDIMLVSTVLAGEPDDFTARFAGDAQLVNVAITRARSRLIIVGNREVCTESGGVLADLAAYVSRLDGDRFDSRVEAVLFDALSAIGIASTPGAEVEGYRLDLAIERNGVRLDVECDGAPFHRDRERDRARDEALARAGWTVLRFSARSVLRDAGECATDVAAQLRSAEAAPDR
jgi:hypothetical protein